MIIMMMMMMMTLMNSTPIRPLAFFNIISGWDVRILVGQILGNNKAYYRIYEKQYLN
jgi:uncharacterized membrane protein